MNVTMSFRDKFRQSSPERASFPHKLLNMVELPAETIEGVGRFYTSPSGVRLPSVTTVLSRSFDDSWLDEWKSRVGEAEAQRVSGRARARGSALHALIEKYVLNQDNVFSDQGLATPMNVAEFMKMKAVIDANLQEVYGVELPLWSDRLRTAGRTDLCGLWNGVASIVDWKTSSKPKNPCDILSYFIQSTVYSLMVEERTGGAVRIPQIVIGIAVEHDEPQFFVREKKLFLEKAIEVFVKNRRNIGI